MSRAYSGGVSSVVVVDDRAYKIYDLNDVDERCITCELFVLNLLEGTKGFPHVLDIKFEPPLYTIVMPNYGHVIAGGDFNPKIPIIDIFAQIVERVAVLHAHNILHGDIKRSNILIDDNDFVTLIDFSHSTMIANFTEVNGIIINGSQKTVYGGTFIGTFCYMPPEVLKHEYNVTCAVDIWSLGIILYNLIADMELSDVHMNEKKLLENIGNIPAEIDAIKGHEFEKSLIRKMLQINPNERPTAIQLLELLNHEYVIPNIYSVNENYATYLRQCGEMRCFDMPSITNYYAQRLYEQIMESFPHKDKYTMCYLAHKIIGICFCDSIQLDTHDVLETSEKYMHQLLFVINNFNMACIYVPRKA